MYIGDEKGNVSVLQFEQESNKILCMQYSIPSYVTHGVVAEVIQDRSVVCILPQPSYEFTRVLIIFRNCLLILWDILESKVLAIGGNEEIQKTEVLTKNYHRGLQSLDPLESKDLEKEKNISSACWASSDGTRIAIGYTNGDIGLWSMPTIRKPKSNSTTKGLESCDSQTSSISKLQLFSSKRKMAIVSIKWYSSNDSCGHLYVYGGVDSNSSNVIRVIRLQIGLGENKNNQCELELVLPEPVTEIAILSRMHSKGIDSGASLLVLSQESHLYAYDDSEIEKRLIDADHNSLLSLPKPIMIKPPFADSSITVAKLFTIPNNNESSHALSQLHRVSKQLFPPTLPVGTKKSTVDNNPYSTYFDGLMKIRSLYITGHSNGMVNVWDASSPLMFLLLSIKTRSDVKATVKSCAVTAMDFCPVSCLLVTGDQLGMVQIYKIVPEHQKVNNHLNKGSSHQGASWDFATGFQKLGVLKVHKSKICCISIDRSSTRVAAGCQEGLVSVIDTKSCTVLSHKSYFSGSSPSICALQFENCILHSSTTLILFVAARDASVIALNGETGDCLTSSILRPKNPSTAIFMHVLEPDINHANGNRDDKLDSAKQSIHCEQTNVSRTDTPQTLLLVCSDNCMWLYSGSAIVQGMKKVYLKEKFQTTCIWASAFHSSRGVGLILLYTTGKVEIRSLPDLSILKETSLRICLSCDLKPSTYLLSTLSCASNGRLIMIDEVKELFHISLLNDDNDFRLFDSMLHVYNKDIQISLYLPAAHPPHMPKKKTIFGTLIKVKRGKTKNSSKNEDQECEMPLGVLELSSIFSTCNFPTSEAGLGEKPTSDSNDEELDIDDLDIEDHDDSFKHEPNGAPKTSSMVKKIRGKLKGKKKSKGGQATSTPIEENEKDVNRVRTVTEIYSAYGHPQLREPSIHEKTKEKLLENQMKLKGINQHATELGEGAQNFQSLAEDILKQVKAKK
ncbi:uncharacterized protein LOC131035216 isoform X2 [Cryptomeria japonica]|nr:uncharacterized protein LOC131035216 isoform X2 [Cryptomeria japonica]XP_057822853.2 uncharacterized protein LOC131035216 isoform X2 [Cryptomeria japonica]XP_057822854.2 uncharacterized protein LOC131035216 isoform X2 [Cryptomeria japonica]XP_057822856.2 uncharacterized protein LOC131035216 isoform X2 [Cryptomeria japonica]